MAEVDFPSNARSDKRPEVKAPPEKKIEQVTTGAVVTRKKPLGKRLRDLFVSGDGKSVGHYIIFDVLVPAAKDVIADVVTQGVERTLFGEGRSTSRRTGQRPGASGHVSYNRYSSASSTPWSKGRDDQRTVSRRARASHDFDEIILATRGEAEEVIDRLFDLVAKYDQATVSDLYDLVGISGNFADEKWGWTDVRGAGVSRVTSGYLLDLPKPEPLD